jgi:hypothetical protein
MRRLLSSLFLCVFAAGSSVPVIPDSQKLALQNLVSRQLMLQVEIERQVAAMQRYCLENGADFKMSSELGEECVAKDKETKQ